MFASILTIVVVAFVVGMGLGLGATAGGRKERENADKELADLKSALDAKQLEIDHIKELHRKRILVAYSVVLDYEIVFDELKKRNQHKKSAVILPLDKILEQ